MVGLGLLVGLFGGLFVGGTGVFGDRTEVFVGRMLKMEGVAAGESMPVAVGVSSKLTGRRGISAM